MIEREGGGDRRVEICRALMFFESILNYLSEGWVRSRESFFKRDHVLNLGFIKDAA